MWLDASSKSSKHRERLKRRACVARWLDDLGDRPYEFASAYAMQVLGASRVHVTPAGSEFGIDFLALIPAYTRSPAFLSGLSGLRVVGQSKKYNSAVTLEDTIVRRLPDCCQEQQSRAVGYYTALV